MGVENNLLSKNAPTILVKEVTEPYSQRNFQALTEYFQAQNQLLDFKFFEVVFSGAEKNRLISHGLSYKPEDIVVTKITGAGSVTFNYGLFTSQYVNITSTGAARVRFYVGKYWASSGNNDASTDVLTVQSSISTATTIAAAAAASATTFLPPPDLQQFTVVGSSTWINRYAFLISSANATAGATYTNNGVTFTVGLTITAGTLLYASAAAPPTTSGILVKTSGTGDSVLTFSQFKAPAYIVAEGVGGGGSGAGGSSGAPTTGNPGSVSTFSTFVSCNPGAAGGANGQIGGVGGVCTISSPAIKIINAEGGSGGGNSACVSANGGGGGDGGDSYFGGAGGHGGGTNIPPSGANATTNSGSGGGGGGYVGAGFGGGGGGAGGYAKFQVNSPATSYALVVGSKGAAVGGSGAGSGISGQGGDGYWVVATYYQ